MEQGAADLPTLSEAVWTVRNRTDELLFAVEVSGLVISAGRVRLASRALEMLERAHERLQVSEHERIRVTEKVAATFALPGGGRATLPRLAAAVDEPWVTILLEHHEALAGMIGSYARATRDNASLLAAALAVTRSQLSRQNPPPAASEHSPAGLLADLVRPLEQLDRELDEVVLSAMLRALHRPLPVTLEAALT